MTAKRRSNTNPGRPTRSMGLARALQKAGCGTRATTEDMVVRGKVSVDGAVVLDPRSSVKPEQRISVGGRDLDTIGYRYFAFHKPARVVCAASDGTDRRRVDEFLPRDVPGLRAAGRLDSKTTGLMLISNDPVWNELAAGGARLEQEYRLQIEGELTDPELGVITAGVHLPNLGLFRPLGVRIVEKMNGATVLTMVLREGKVRQVRRMFDTLRHRIMLLRRIRVGEIRLGDLAAGSLRPLTGHEVQGVRDAG